MSVEKQDSENQGSNFKTPNNTPIRGKYTSKKSRTPSGQILTSSVKDIRNFFNKLIALSQT